MLKAVEKRTLSRLVPDSKLALSLDCWSSSTRLSFMGVMAHYIDKDWYLQEELIGFESLQDVHSGAALASVVNELLKKYCIEHRVVSITTDNARNNGTMMTQINEYLEEAFANTRFLDGKIQHIPCLSHIIQLALKELLGAIRLRPTNDTLIQNWIEDQELNDLEQIERITQRGLPYTLAKV
jgi:hypothetical protein